VTAGLGAIGQEARLRRTGPALTGRQAGDRLNIELLIEASKVPVQREQVPRHGHHFLAAIPSLGISGVDTGNQTGSQAHALYVKPVLIIWKGYPVAGICALFLPEHKRYLGSRVVCANCKRAGQGGTPDRLAR
jgi:hypothetical protein